MREASCIFIKLRKLLVSFNHCKYGKVAFVQKLVVLQLVKICLDFFYKPKVHCYAQ